MPGFPFFSALALFAGSLLLLAARTQALPARDWALAVPYAAKAALPAYLAFKAGISGMVEEPLYSGVPLTIGLLGVTVPDLLVLGSLASGDGATVRSFRRGARWAESLAAGAMFAQGALILAIEGPRDRHGGVILVTGAAWLLSLAIPF